MSTTTESISTNLSLPLVPANVIDQSLTISPPQYAGKQLIETIQTWVEKQGRHWPPELTSEVLAKNLITVYLPYWVIQVNGSGHWTASVGVDRKVPERCGTCNGKGVYTPVWANSEQRCDRCGGSGQDLVNKTFWGSQSGIVSAEVGGDVAENFDTDILKLRGKRDFSAPESRLEQTNANLYQIIRPLKTNAASSQGVAEATLKKNLADKAGTTAGKLGDYVKDLDIAYVQIDQFKARIWLYPLIIGYYSHDDEPTLLVQVDGITGEVYGEAPRGVKDKRQRDAIMYGLIALVVIAIIVVVILARPQ